MRKTYSKAFKINIAKQINNKQTTVSSVASEYGISRPIISRWVSEYNRYGNEAFAGKGVKLPDKAKQFALEEEVQRLKQENEILKKFERFVKLEKK